MAPLGEENKSSHFTDWNQIDSILLDLDGTLLDLNFDLHFWLKYLPQVYSEKHSISHQEAQDILMLMLNAEKGKLNWYCIDFWIFEHLKQLLVPLRCFGFYLSAIHLEL